LNISVFGLGYVGCINLGCLAKNGNKVIGVDISQTKVDLINSGKPTVMEKDIGNIIREVHGLGRIEATLDYKKAVINTDISIICVGTPSTNKGHLNLDYIYKVSEQIGRGLIKKRGFHVIVIRSTVIPGTNKKVGDIIEKISNKKRGSDFDIISNPEFLREGTSVHDYYNPPMIVLGGKNKKALNIVEKLYQDINAPIYKVDCKIAELIKYINNSFHALKVAFANEVGNICKKLEIDSHELMNLFCKDSILNISPYYFKPGFAYGGPCLPKDLKALNAIAKELKLKTSVLNSISISNNNHKKYALDLIMEKGKKNIGIFGLSFKEGTDDLRYSPTIDILKKLIDNNYSVLIYDKYINFTSLLGENRKYIEKTIPNILQMLSDDIEHVAKNSEVLVFCNKEEEFTNILKNFQNKIIIDFVRIAGNENHVGEYEGICW